MDVTEICKGCFSRKHGDEASACPYCEYEEGIVDVDGAGWKTGQLLSKRYLLGTRPEIRADLSGMGN